MQVFGPDELYADVLEADLCIGCGACVDLCPYFRNHNGRTVRLFPCDLPQGRCYAFCPKAGVDLDLLSTQVWGKTYDGSPLGHYREVIAARAGKKMMAGRFQGGGTVSALAAFALKTGVIDAAILTGGEGATPVARRVTGWKDVADCAGTKLMAAPTLAALNVGVNAGDTRLGVIGTPCQMLAVAQMRGNPLAQENFTDPVALAIGLFCNWALDTRQLTVFLADKLDVSTISGMDVPPPPADVLIVTAGNRRVEIPLSEVRPLIPRTCFACLDMTSEYADVSVGMFEGRPGWNTLIIRSAAGAGLIDRARDAGFLETAAMPASNQTHLSDAAGAKKQRALRTLIRRDLIDNPIDSSGRRRSAVRMAPEIIEKIRGEAA